MAARKWNTVAILDMIADKNGWRRPKTTLLTRGCHIPVDTVLKRSHSDCGEFVIMPEEPLKTSGTATKWPRGVQRLLHTWEELDARTNAPEQRWVSQEYVDTLVKIGEWRCFLVGGHVMNVVHTMKMDEASWHGKRISNFLTLAEMRYVASADYGLHGL